MKIDILQLLDGARSARGLTVVIDVFRAFSVECYALSGGAKTIYAVGDIDQASASGLCAGGRARRRKVSRL